MSLLFTIVDDVGPGVHLLRPSSAPAPERIPGLTWTWRASGRSLIPFEQQVQLNLAYIHTRSLLTDLQILLRTVPAVLSGRGAH